MILTLIITLLGREIRCYYIHFTDEKTVAYKRFSDLGTELQLAHLVSLCELL